MLATTFFCIGIAALISIGTSNVYAVTGRIVIYIFSGGLLIFIVFFVYVPDDNWKKTYEVEI